MSDIDGTGPGVGGGHAAQASVPAATPSRPGRLGVGIISAGRVGAVLGCALRAVEHQVVGVHAVSEDSRERAEMLLPGVPVLEVEEIVERAELVLLAVPDDALEPLVRGWRTWGAGSRASWWPTPRAVTARLFWLPPSAAGRSRWRSTRR